MLRDATLLLSIALAGPCLAGDTPTGPVGRIARLEIAEMIRAIPKGARMGPEDGWFHPGQTRYGWAWLASRYDADGDGAIAPAEFRGPAEFFGRLDRDRSGAIRADDLDWSDRSPQLLATRRADARFRRMDADSNGKLSLAEFDAFFARSARGKAELSPEDLRDALDPPPPPPGSAMPPGSSSDAPDPVRLALGLVTAEVGSAQEGPRVGAEAPDFALKGRDGATYRLSDSRGKRPVVLVFGSFTCAPYRAQFGTIDDLHRRYGDRATFLSVYVREAHPMEYWRMAYNDRAGVAVPRPRTYGDRAEAASRFCSAVRTEIPVLVDGLDDAVGHAYSGMPNRLYVVDASGRVAYQGGRGPFGLKPGEMEQALIGTLLDGEATSAAPRP